MRVWQGFLGAEQALHVPLSMMDRACKNKGGKYREEGEASLRFVTAPAEPASGGVSPATPPPGEVERV